MVSELLFIVVPRTEPRVLWMLSEPTTELQPQPKKDLLQLLPLMQTEAQPSD